MQAQEVGDTKLKKSDRLFKRLFSRLDILTSDNFSHFQDLQTSYFMPQNWWS